MRLALIFALATLTAATSLHLLPSTERKLLQQQPQQNPVEQVKNYQDQDSRGFYSYGYSGDSAAKAEYTTLDGSARGYYAYVDSDGQLQAVNYEAGKRQGFQASGTNLPMTQSRSSATPTPAAVPVNYTPEVAAAREAHFAAYRKAAALAEQQQQSAQEARQQKQRVAIEQLQRDQEREANAAAAAADYNEDGNEGEAAPIDISDELKEQIMAILAKEVRQQQRQQANSEKRLMANGQAIAENPEQLRNSDQLLLEQAQQANVEQENDDNRQANAALANQMTSYTLKDGNGNNNDANDDRNNNDNNNLAIATQAADILNLRTLYTLQNENANSYFKFADLHGEGGTLNVGERLEEALQPRVLDEIVRVPVNSYYTVDSPSTKYTVNTPTILKNVPRSEAQRLGHSLPVSLSSTFQAQRLSSNSN